MQKEAIGESQVRHSSETLVKMDELPGPTGLPVLGSLLEIKVEKLHRIIENWSRQYGPIFKIKLGNIPILVVTSPEAIQYVLKNRPDKFCRMSKMDVIIRELGVHGVFNAEGDDWKRQRKLISQALSIQQLKNFFPVLADITGILFKHFNELSANDKSIEIGSELMRYTVDVTSQLGFGYNMNSIEKNGDVIQENLEVIFPAIFKRINAPIPYWRFFKFPSDRKLDRSLRVINSMMQNIIDETRKKLEQDTSLQTKPANFLQALLSASDPADPVSNRVIIGNVLTMLLAGEDTTAHSMAWIFYFMHVVPGVQEKMQKEVDLVLGDGQTLLRNYDDAARLTYIEAIALEAMRLKPVSPTLFHDALTDVVIEGVEVPKGTGIFLETRYAAIDNKNFSDAEKFIPERWMQGTCPAGFTHNEKASIPFGAGPRFCPGYQLAMLEIKAVLAMVCRNFTVNMETRPEDVGEILRFTMKPSDFYIRLVRRRS